MHTNFLRRYPGNAGFTLIEMMMVMVLIVIILGVSTVFFANRLPSENLTATGREMSAMLRFARLLARNSGEQRSVFINLDTGRYGILGIQTRKIPGDVSVTITDPLEGDLMRGEYTVVFNGSGGSNWGRITLTGGRRAIRIDIDPVLGAAVAK